MSRIPRAAGLVLALVGAIGLSWASHAPLAVREDGKAALRLSWSARPERIESCRAQTEQELAKLPAHMRQPVICEGGSAVYRLEVRRDGRLLADDLVRGGGLRHDRPLYVFREIPQTPGSALITVRFDRTDPAPAPGQTVQLNSTANQVADLPRSLVLERRVQFGAGAVVLVTYDPEQRALLVKDRQ